MRRPFFISLPRNSRLFAAGFPFPLVRSGGRQGVGPLKRNRASGAAAKIASRLVKGPAVAVYPRISIAAHSLDGSANQEGWGARGEGRTESGHMLLVSMGRARPRQDTNGLPATRPGEWHQVARRSGWLPCTLFFHSRRSAGRPAGSVDGVPAGTAGVSCRGPAQRAGPADVAPVLPAVRVRAAGSAPVCVPLLS